MRHRVSLCTVLGAGRLHPVSTLPLSELEPMLTWTGTFWWPYLLVIVPIWSLLLTPLGPTWTPLILVVVDLSVSPQLKRTLVMTGMAIVLPSVVISPIVLTLGMVA